MIEYILYTIGGFLVATIGSMSGIGGGVFMVPLFYHMGYPIEKAIGTSLLVIVFNSISASINYWRRGVLKPGKWVLMVILMIPASMVGAQTTALAPRKILTVVVSTIIIIFGISMLVRSLRGRAQSRSQNSRLSNPLIAPLVFIIAGFIAGLTGIGGGAILMPILVSVLRAQIHTAVAVSMLSIVVSSTSGSIIHIANGNVIFNLAIPFTLGALIGGNVGSTIASKTKPKILTIIVGIVLTIVGILTIYS
ncbi:MAG: sulfite exporter TauE/SafE family protein [Acidilobaceae archaeon]